MPERKHIKIKGVLCKDNSKVKLTVLERSHDSKDFGTNKGIHKWSWEGWSFVNGDLRIYHEPIHTPRFLYGLSSPNPEVKDCFLIGEGSCEVSLKDWRRIKAAVQAYNEYFKG